jgi:5-(carboxyamino)imidazole ribonucleotide synthase
MIIIPPGSTIGILGGGQLGRMTALAAANLGYHCHIYCPEKDAPALEVSAAHTRGDFEDTATLEDFAKTVDVVTLEWENVPVSALETLARYKPVHPGPSVLRVAQDRVQEKTFARRHGIGTADFTAVHNADELKKALEKFARPAILKSTRFGYDGKGQVKITAETAATEAWAEMGGDAGIIEAYVPFACEISVIVARRSDGVMAAYPAVENIHRNHILAETHAPARIAPDIAKEAETLACRMAEKLEVVGLLGVELFVLKEPNAAGQRVLLNEIAPRPHNSGHWTMNACACSQFEQLVRAICGLPLGPVLPHSRAVMHNLLGVDALRWQEWLAEPAASLHLYGKKEARAGRKMGHVNILLGAW